ncbi:hypothetical protein KAR91_45710 [Candidatus Pacearchaeota archaeon]|nr:hypothetical protein [Candidatus Pacearchaeota archaeon]
MEHKFRTPVKCQNGHKAFWYWKHSDRHFLQIETIQKPPDNTCGCSKFAIGEGWERDGDDQMFTGLKGKHGIEIYNGDIILYDDEHRDKSIVVFEYGAFQVESVGGSFPGECWTFSEDYLGEYEVIGSTHLTPELVLE